MTDTETAPDLASRRADTLTRIEEAERDQGAALLDGGKADGSALLALHSELTVIEAADREASRRAREAEEAEAHAARIEAAKRGATHLSALAAAFGAAERHAEAFAAEARKAMEAAKLLRAEAPAIGVRIPLGLDQNASVAKALSHIVGNALDRIEQPLRFGHFKWPGPMLRQDIPATMTAAFGPLIEELTNAD